VSFFSVLHFLKHHCTSIFPRNLSYNFVFVFLFTWIKQSQKMKRAQHFTTSLSVHNHKPFVKICTSRRHNVKMACTSTLVSNMHEIFYTAFIRVTCSQLLQPSKFLLFWSITRLQSRNSLILTQWCIPWESTMRAQRIKKKIRLYGQHQKIMHPVWMHLLPRVGQYFPINFWTCRRNKVTQAHLW